MKKNICLVSKMFRILVFSDDPTFHRIHAYSLVSSTALMRLHVINKNLVVSTILCVQWLGWSYYLYADSSVRVHREGTFSVIQITNMNIQPFSCFNTRRYCVTNNRLQGVILFPTRQIDFCIILNIQQVDPFTLE